MSGFTEPEIAWSQDQMIEVTLNEPDDFLKVRETLTCLLYTSPSPRDATLSRMPSSA